ncbi:flagellar hook capping FlgD N-terminal domain-containing protein [Silvanigrella aquatica]|uniref:Basal-body rod modification protein FlgD n=1 Tax=Silvanigrella aquatica TaxID=1915309 RepID=A0A1L4D236_9BACT|nr:FlgD immunoglobulin-like domain containing protein [Silvanigrella aquatica]APJ04251.1 hypothetical protein AXG55_10165 [Silvanigrella aquatica]
MDIGAARGLAKIPEQPLEPPKSAGLKMEKGDEAINFDDMISSSNQARQAEIEKEKNEAGGDFRLGETKNDREFRQQLEKVTGKKLNTPKNKMERDDYLNLLVTQLKYQDPSKPMEHYEMASQMAQFNTVEQLMGVNKVLADMKKMQNEAKAEKLTQYLGKDIEIQGNNVRLSPDGTANTMKFELPSAASNAIVEIRDEHLKVVKSIHMGAVQIGTNKVTWDGTNDKGNKLPGGDYTFSVLSSTEDGKPMTAKTSFMAKVEGISDIFSGGKLDTTVGAADPSKIIAIRNPEVADANKANKSQLAAYAQNGAQVGQPQNKDPGAQKQLNPNDPNNPPANQGMNNAPMNLGSNNPNSSSPQNSDANTAKSPYERAPLNNTKPLAEARPIFSSTPPWEQKPGASANVTEETRSPPAKTVMNSTPKPQSSLDEFKAAPKYGGAPAVAGISGRAN